MKDGRQGYRLAIHFSLTMLLVLVPLIGAFSAPLKAEAAEYMTDMDYPAVRSSWAAAKPGEAVNSALVYKDNTSVIVDTYGDYVSTLSLSLRDTGELNLTPDPLTGALAAEISGLVVKTSDHDGTMRNVWANGLYAVTGNDSAYSISFRNVAEMEDGSLIAVGEIAPGANVSEDADVVLKDFSGGTWTVRVNYSVHNGVDSDALIMKMDTAGRPLWVGSLGGHDHDILHSVKATADGGFAAAGESGSLDGDFIAGSRGGTDGFLVKYAAGGVREWLQNIGGTKEDKLNGVTILPDGGYAVVGSSASSSLNTKPEASDYGPASLAAANAVSLVRGLIVRLDRDGKLLWGKSYNPAEISAVLNDAVLSADGTFLVAVGNAYWPRPGAVAVKYGLDNGNLLSERSYSNPADNTLSGSSEQWQDTLSAVVPAPGGGYLFMGQALSLDGDFGKVAEGPTGSANPKGGDPVDFIVIKTDEALEMEWLGFYGSTGHEQIRGWGGSPAYLHTMAATPDGFVLAGYAQLGAKGVLDGDFTGASSAGTAYPSYNAVGTLLSPGTYSVVSRFTFDWDHDGVINSRDLYPQEPRYSIPFGNDADKIDLNAALARTLNGGAFTEPDINDLPPVANVGIALNGASLTVPVAALDRIFGNSKRTLVVSSTYESEPGSEIIAVIPPGREVVSTFRLDARLNGVEVADFGTNIEANVAVEGLANSARAKLYYYTVGGTDGPELVPVSGADFSAGASVTFQTKHLAAYVVTVPSADQLAADPVIGQIAALPPQVSTAQSQLVSDARAAYEALTPGQRVLVTNFALLTNAEAQLVVMEDLRKQLIAINPVLARFSILPDAGAVSLDDQEEIYEARAAYEALTGQQKEMILSVDNLSMYTRLLDAEAALQLLFAQENQLQANRVIAAIAALPQTITLVNQTAVAAARSLYSALTAEQQDLVDNYAKLAAAEVQIAAQSAQTAGLQDQVNELRSALVDEIARTKEAINASGPVISTNGMAVVTPSLGGSIILGSEAAVEIPAGALSGTTKVNVKIKEVVNPPAAPLTLTPASPVYEFTVGSGTAYSFAKPVTIIVAFDPAKIPDGRSAAIYYYDGPTEQWVRVGGTVNGSAVAAAVYHFTKFAVFAESATPGEAAVEPKTVTSAVYFADIAGHWAQDYIEQMTQQGVIGGYPDETFRPNRTITRAEFATLLVKALGLNGAGETDYADISRHWARESIRIAGYHQIVNGYPDGRFLPDQPVSREEMVVMAVYAFQLVGGGNTEFTDSGDISDWAQTAVQTAVQAGIISGQSGSLFSPQAAATRAEAVTVLAKALALN